jgi:hypothetical protein
MAGSIKRPRPWPPQLNQITPEDLIASGACHRGVVAYMLRRGLILTAITVADALATVGNDVAHHVHRAAGHHGDGDGYGYGDGDGDGDGYGYGYGDGYGYVDGYGYGYGDGDGYGDGYGDG